MCLLNTYHNYKLCPEEWGHATTEREAISFKKGCPMGTAQFACEANGMDAECKCSMAYCRLFGSIADDTLLGTTGAASRRLPAQTKHRVMIHSDQGPQFTSCEWQTFLRQHNLDASLSRRGNCHDNAVAEIFCHLLRRERIRRCTYRTRNVARRDVFECFECSTTRNANTRTMSCCRPLASRSNSRN